MRRSHLYSRTPSSAAAAPGGLALLVVLAVAQWPTAAVAEEEARISAVTVFEDRARVERTLRVPLTAGVHEVRFLRLAGALIEPSVGARATMPESPVQVLGVRLERDEQSEDQRAEVRELEAQIRTRLDLDDRHRHRIEALRKISGLIDDYAKLLHRSLEERSAAESWTLEQTDATLSAVRALGEWEQKGAEERQALERQRQDLARELQNLRANLARLGQGLGRSSYLALVSIEVRAAGDVDVVLSYDVGAARWRPIYEARLAEADGKVELAYFAQVEQQSGEDWNDVQLTLSTARSSLGLAPPRLVPLRVAGYPKGSREVGLVAAAPAAKPGAAAPPGAPAADPASGEDLSQARVRTGAAPVRFEIRTPVRVPSDGQPHLATIRTLELAGSLSYEAIPRLEPHVYRKADLVNASELPLLPGTARVFRDGAFVGETPVRAVAPKEGFSMYFGAEGRLTARRVELLRKAEAAGTFSSQSRITIGYRFELENYLGRPVTVALRDTIPISDLEEVTVELTSQTQPRPSELGPEGVLTWNVALGAGEKKKVALEYIVRHPYDLPLPPDWFQ